MRSDGEPVDQLSRHTAGEGHRRHFGLASPKRDMRGLKEQGTSCRDYIRRASVTAPAWPTLETVHSARSGSISSRYCSPTTRVSGSSDPLRHPTAAKASFQSNGRRRRLGPRTDARPLAASLSNSLALWPVLAHSWRE